MVNKYVTDYDGEYVVSGIVVKNGCKHQDRFWIPHTVPNSDHKKVAYVVGNGTSRINYSGVAMKLSYLTTAGGGHFGAYKGQCYGCNRIYQDPWLTWCAWLRRNPPYPENVPNQKKSQALAQIVQVY